ncbi:MAG: cytochrome-c peroxidase [Oceanospirillaceae bacterium]|nr:cytochrome-c peroxidase [Oceanospirillaceae bacterium]|tara:strand:- start:3541 stop:4758 length:1218 start_codon:yes stop_codon:yes gene_type:complete
MTSGVNPFRHFLLAGMVMVVLMFVLKFLAASLIEGEQLKPVLDWFGHEHQQSAGIQSETQSIPGHTNPVTPRSSVRYQWQALPDRPPSPMHNPWNKARAEVGKRLFSDTNLSLDRSVSCASCHDNDTHAGADGRPTAVGVGGQAGPRNSPTVWNSAYQQWLFWDGRAASLEEQAIGPLLNPIEMAMPSAEALVARVREDRVYIELFEQAFGSADAIGINEIVAALAAYQRTLITPDSPYDRYVRGDTSALNPVQLRGMALFEELGCVNCHSGPNFSGAGILANNSPWRIFPALDTPFEQQYQLTEDLGMAPAGSTKGVWRIPSLRNVAQTAPYFHNGSVTELEEAVRIMASAQLGHQLAQTASESEFVWSDDGYLIPVQRRTVTEQEVQAIVAFLESLSGELSHY